MHKSMGNLIIIIEKERLIREWSSQEKQKLEFVKKNDCCMSNLYISQFLLIVFEYSATCLSVIFLLFPGLIPFASL